MALAFQIALTCLIISAVCVLWHFGERAALTRRQRGRKARVADLYGRSAGAVEETRQAS